MQAPQQAGQDPPERPRASADHINMDDIVSAGPLDDADNITSGSFIAVRASGPEADALHKIIDGPQPPSADTRQAGEKPVDYPTSSLASAQALGVNGTTLAGASQGVSSMPTAPDFWQNFGLTVLGEGIYTLPAGVIGLQANGEQHHTALIEVLKIMTVPPHVSLVLGERRLALFKVARPDLLSELANNLPDGVTLVRESMPVALDAIELGRTKAQTVDELSELTAADLAAMCKPAIDPAVTSNPLLRFSLQGQSEKFRLMAVEAHPLLGEVCLRGQVTIWYAAPNTGKTLIALNLVRDAVADGRINPQNVFYVNADDNGAGFASKIQLMDDLGAHVLAPGFRGLEREEMVKHLQRMAEADEARGVLIILDTLKKFADLMDKKHSSAIAQAFRAVAMRGGTVLALAHTTKNSNSDGTPRYAGTTDIVDDADAAYTINPLSGAGDAREKVVEFRCFKSRGACAERAAYAFAAEKGIAYEELLASVRLVDPDQMDEFRRVEEERSDAELIEVVKTCIAEGINTKMLLVKEAAKRSRVSERAVIRLIKRYTGDDPAQHRWNFVRREHGAQVFEPCRAEPGAHAQAGSFGRLAGTRERAALPVAAKLRVLRGLRVASSPPPLPLPRRGPKLARCTTAWRRLAAADPPPMPRAAACPARACAAARQLDTRKEPSPMKTKLDAAVVAAAECPPGKRRLDIYCTHVTGLMLEVRASGGKTYYARYVDAHGVLKQPKIARADQITFDQARKAAKRIIAEAALGNDPQKEKAERRAVPTYNELADQHLAYGRASLRDPGTLEGYLKRVRKRFGRLRLTDIKPQDVTAWLAELRQEGLAPATVEKVRMTMSRSFSLAAQWNVPGAEKSPMRGVPKLRFANARERFIDSDEAARLLEAAGRSRNRDLAAIVGLLLLLGMRVSELLSMRLANVDVPGRSLLITQSKNGTARRLPLPQAAVDIIEGLARPAGSVFLFPNPRDPTKHLTTIKHGWHVARDAAGLEGLRIHDLRHSAASAWLNQGVPLATIGVLLGHKSVVSTARYSHLADDTLMSAMELGAAKLKIGAPA